MKGHHQVQIAGHYADLRLLPPTFSLQGFLYDPEASERLTRRRMKLALTVVFPVALLLGGLVLVFLRMNRRQAQSFQALREMDAVLQDNERRFRFITEHTADVIWTMDIATGRFTYVNPSVKQLLGYAPDELVSQSATLGLTPESTARVTAILAEAAAAWETGRPGPPRRLELDHFHKDGHLVPTEAMTTLHGDAEGRLVSVLGVSRDITERRRTEAKLRESFQSLEKLASTDLLTSAWNRRHFEEAVEGEMHRSRRYGHPLSLLMLDIDHFKQINDAFGHAEGDRVLREVAGRVREAIRVSDSLTRWGGEEFLVLMPNTGLSSAAILAERIRDSLLERPFENVGQVTASFGLAEYLPTGSRDEWVKRADQAMYKAKDAGRNRVEMDVLRGDASLGAEHLEGTFLKLIWKDTYLSGNALIDSQHQHLFHLANDLLDAVLSGRPKDELSALVNRLVAEVVQHFRDEEEVLATLKYPQLEGHAGKHAALVAKALELERAFQADTLSVGALFQFLVQDVVALHLLKADREFFHLLAVL